MSRNAVLVTSLGFACVAAWIAAGAREGASQPDALPARAQQFMEMVNDEAVTPSAELRDYLDLKVRIHLRIDGNPRAGLGQWSHGVGMSGLRHVDDLPVGAEGVLTAVAEHAVVVTGSNGHAWIPRDQIRAVEVLQNPSTAP